MEVIEPDSSNSLQGQLLIAMPGLADTWFGHSVIYICEHTREGTMGLIINQPLKMPLSQLFKQLELPCPESISNKPLLLGGPVQQQRGFILHRNTDTKWLSTAPVNEQISLTSSRDIIEAIASNKGPADSLIILGYAGWGAGQLEQELLDNAWLTTPINNEFLFETPFDDRARVAAAHINVDLDQLSNNAGHA